MYKNVIRFTIRLLINHKMSKIPLKYIKYLEYKQNTHNQGLKYLNT